ncbi:hypothetical protein [Tateyamaria sp.]|uniref:hypothetical protein n=1 Tax=Tateyamaria sp. TaxID=1929288 RepID=UPI003B222488
MKDGLFVLKAEYPNKVSVLFSADRKALQDFGLDHHRASNPKPRLSLITPKGQPVAEMDEWSLGWTECPVPASSGGENG